MSNDSGAPTASVRVVEEKDAPGKVAEIYEDIKRTLGIDFVPNMYRALAVNPDYLEKSASFKKPAPITLPKCGLREIVLDS